jgi:hypothetical protein
MTALLERLESIEEERMEIRTTTIAKNNGKDAKGPAEETPLQRIFEGHREFLGCTPD